MDVEESSSDVSFTNASSLFQLIFKEEDNIISTKLKRIMDISERITSKNQLDVAFDLAVLIVGCEVKIFPFFPNKRPVNGPLSYFQRTKISTLDDSSLAFDDVHIVKDSVYVSLNIGRLYYWLVFIAFS